MGRTSIDALISSIDHIALGENGRIRESELKPEELKQVQELTNQLFQYTTDVRVTQATKDKANNAVQNIQTWIELQFEIAKLEKTLEGEVPEWVHRTPEERTQIQNRIQQLEQTLQQSRVTPLPRETVNRLTQSIAQWREGIQSAMQQMAHLQTQSQFVTEDGVLAEQISRFGQGVVNGMSFTPEQAQQLDAWLEHARANPDAFPITRQAMQSVMGQWVGAAPDGTVYRDMVDSRIIEYAEKVMGYRYADRPVVMTVDEIQKQTTEHTQPSHDALQPVQQPVEQPMETDTVSHIPETFAPVEWEAPEATIDGNTDHCLHPGHLRRRTWSALRDQLIEADVYRPCNRWRGADATSM